MRISKRSVRTSRMAVAAIASTSMLLAACSPSGESDSEQTMSDASSSVASATADAGDEQNAEEGLTFTEAYVTAKPAEKAMTGVFGELTNNTDADIVLTEAKASVDGRIEFHIVKDGEMMEAKDGFTIPAGETLTLQPGHEHIMIMDNNDELAAGDAVTFTLTDKDGKTYELKDVPVRVQQSTHEHYKDGEDSGAPMSSENMGDMEHGGDHSGHDHQ